ncbi:hypothetical protein HMP0721_0951 [Pseudoramibacter alactolyticus ATCC 23263]|uniref:Uncharacterized protein n=1 Tax=Pseudoramibacter alactolyticus ATCC 23263 TaxID=887929 RepID=E6MG18_9FIRM|nr:hypothetical protein HMP0721_0951 [Pseudoramibacter alactolyticus ATCC 23263]
MNRGKKWLSNEISHLVYTRNWIIIFDAITQKDINTISEVVILSKIKFISVDPGPFTVTLAPKLIVPRKSNRDKKILVLNYPREC